MNYWNHAAGEPWVMTEPALQSMLVTLKQQRDDIDALAAKAGTALDHTVTAYVRDGVAIIPVSGPLFRYPNFFTVFLGASSYDVLAKDFTQAIENPDVYAVVLDVDSPGGEVNGCAELASLIFDARGHKPVIAYASGDAASGAYWLASACDEIVVSETSALGSIGVVALYQNKAKDSHNNRTEIVSSQSPYKRLDPEKEDDKARLQHRIDALAGVFIESVARHRGVDPPQVKKQYGRGDIFIGKHAVSQGLADRVGSLEKLIKQLHHTQDENPATARGSSFLGVGFREDETMSTIRDSSGNPPVQGSHSQQQKDPQNKLQKKPHNKSQQEFEKQPSQKTRACGDEGGASADTLNLETLKNNHGDLVAQLVAGEQANAKQSGLAEGKQNERERIGAILGSEEAKGRESLAQHLAFSTDMDVDMVVNTLAASPKQIQSSEASTRASPGFEKVMAAIDNPAIEPDGDAGESEENAEDVAKRIAAYSVGGEV